MRPLNVFAAGMGADAIALVVKVSAVLLVATVATLFMRHSSAARRHYVWYVAICGCLSLTVFQAVLPPIALRLSASSPMGQALRVLIPANEVRTQRPVTIEGARDAISRAFDATGRIEAYVNARPNGIATSLGTSIAPSVPSNAGKNAGTETGTNAVPNVRNNTATNAQSTAQDASITIGGQRFINYVVARMREFSGTIVVALWLIGFALVLLRFAIAHARLAWLVRTSRAMTDLKWRAQLTQTCVALGVSKHVRLLLHTDVTTPFTAGFLRPVVIVPETSAEWDASRRNAVLLHELAHVERGDYLALVVSTVVCALFWFHPGVWFAAHKLRNESESAADDCVVTHGVPSVHYASHLLALADYSRTTGGAPEIALGMARISQLEWRLRAMLDERRSHREVSRHARRMFAVVALLVVAPLAGLRAEAARANTSLGSVLPSETLPRGNDPAKAGVRSNANLGSVLGGNSSPKFAAVGMESNENLKSFGTMLRNDSVHSTRAAASTARGDLVIEPIIKTTQALLPNVSVSASMFAHNDSTSALVDALFDKTVSVVDTVALAMEWGTGGNLTVHEWDNSAVRLVAVIGGSRASLARVTLDQRADSVIIHSFYSDGSKGPTPEAQFEIWMPRSARHGNYGNWSGSGKIRFPGRTSGERLTIQGQSVALLRPEQLANPPVALPLTGSGSRIKIRGQASVPLRNETSTGPPVTLPKSPGSTDPAVDTSFDRILPAMVGRQLLLDLPFGGDVIIHAWDKPSARLVANTTGTFWGGTRVMFYDLGGSGVRLLTFSVDSGVRVPLGYSEPEAVTPKDPSVVPTNGNRFELWIPRATDIVLSSRAGSFTVADVDGDLTGFAEAGDIDITNSHGNVNLQTGVGNVHVSQGTLIGTVITRCGTITLDNVKGRLNGFANVSSVIRNVAQGVNVSSDPLIYIDGELQQPQRSCAKNGSAK